MTSFYTYFSRHGDKVLYRGYDESGKRVTAEVPYQPALYIKDTAPSEFKSMYGYPLIEKKFESMSAAKDFCKTFESTLVIHGNTAFEYDFIHRAFQSELQVDISKLKIAICDIETCTEAGFPNIEDPNEVVQLVSFIDYATKELTTYGIHPSKAKGYVLCADENDLLIKVCQYIISEDLDVITGWNSIYFDGAYLFGRIEKILGKSALQRVSPFGKVYRKVDNLMGRERVRYEIVGRVQLDMLDLYKKYRFVNRPSYKLGYIGEVEVSETKTENPYATFKEHYEKDWESFVEYNQQDVRLVDKLEAKLGLVYLAVSLAYMTKVNYDDVYSPIKLWENFIKHTLLNENTFCPVTKPSSGPDYSIEGGYVAKPVPGNYGWSVAFDATALYPSIIMSLNMSPETLVGQVPDVSVDALFAGLLKPNELGGVDISDCGMAANGAVFRKDVQGILARLTKLTFDKRKAYKKDMLNAKSEKELIMVEMKRRGLI